MPCRAVAAALLVLFAPAAAAGQGAFTDDPIVPGETPVKAVHFTELRSRIGARVGHRMLRLDGPDAAGRARRPAAHPAGRRIGVRASPARAPAGPRAMVVGEHDFPDVVLEVDHTTDVRRAKLGLYEAWGFPEVWVEVPDRRPAGGPRRRRPGLTIHRRVAGTFHPSAASGAFPGWTAAEIHASLNEPLPSERTFAVLRRVGAALGARDGTGPDDDPALGWHRRQVRLRMVREILRARGIAVSDQGLARVPEIDVMPEDETVRAALACDDEADFLARLRRRG